MLRFALIGAFAVLVGTAPAQPRFVNWETGHVSPLAKSPDGTRLLAVNTPDNRLEIYDVSNGDPVHLASVPVGLDPISVRARTNTEFWVVNHVSDSISVVELGPPGSVTPTFHVVRTIQTEDEPRDVVFAGTEVERAFISCAQPNKVMAIDPNSPPVLAPVTVDVQGEEPRMLAVSPDGSKVYCAMFASGNRTTILGGGSTLGTPDPPNVVSSTFSPYYVSGPAAPNPPPNSGTGFDPPIDPNLPTPPRVGLIVRKDTTTGQWLDDNGGDWTDVVSGMNAAESGRETNWDVLDNDLAIIDADAPDTMTTQYAHDLMNIVMAIAVNPASGFVSVIGTDAINEVRFEPNLNGRFVRVKGGLVDPSTAATLGVVDLNPYLGSYTMPFLTQQAQKDFALGDPRGIEWSSDGLRAYVTGMGSNSVVVVDPGGLRIGNPIPVGNGPTGIVLNEPDDRAYVLNKFDGSITTIRLSGVAPPSTVAMHDPSPAAVKNGRRHFYDTNETSGYGQVACASCHVDGRIDWLSWDLGDPTGAPTSDVKDPDDQNLGGGNFGLAFGYESWHPMKGPMATQTMQDIIGKEPHHWRGDRRGIEEFNPAFTNLLGDDVELTDVQMQEFEDFLATIHFPPNPFRNLDNSLPTNLPIEDHYATGQFTLQKGDPLPNGNAAMGFRDFACDDGCTDPDPAKDGAFFCINCHTLPTGMGTHEAFDPISSQYQPLPLGQDGESHVSLSASDAATNVAIKIPHLRNMRDKSGFSLDKSPSRRGFGFLHDGSIDSISTFFSGPFMFHGDQQLADMVAFMLAFSGSDLAGSDGSSLQFPSGPESLDTHAAVGQQVTFNTPFSMAPSMDVQRMVQFIALADANAVGLVGKGRVSGQPLGLTYLPGSPLLIWALDQQGTFIDGMGLVSIVGVSPGDEFTFTVVPKGTEFRIGIDRDGDGCLDADERASGTDPADPSDCTCSSSLASTPTGLTATTSGLYGIDLAWTDNALLEYGYVVYRRTGGSNFRPVATLPANTTSYRDKNLTQGTAYDYRVSVVNCAGESAPATATQSTTAVASLPDMAVSAITITKSCNMAGTEIAAIATVVITRDPLGSPFPVLKAKVKGRFSGATTQENLFGEVTLAPGPPPLGGAVASFVSTPVDLAVNPNPTFTFTVDDVFEMLHVYNPALNVETSDSATFSSCP